MDPVTTALLSAISSGLNNLATDAAKDAYKTAKHLIKQKLGISSVIDELEANPESRQRQTRLIEELAAKEAGADPELVALAQRLIEAIKETEAGRKTLGKYHIEATGSQVGIIGDGIRVEGGIHFHNYGSTGGADPSLEADIKVYCENTRSLYENLPLIGFGTKRRPPILIADIYVPLMAMVDCRATGSSCFGDSFEAEKELGNNCADIRLTEVFSKASEWNRCGIVILGDPGSGKTTHLKQLLLLCLQQQWDELKLPADIIPVYLPLRELSDLKQGLDAFIQAQLDKPHLGTPTGFGKRLVGRGNLLFLLDGLDEVADSDQRAGVVRWIDEAVKVHRGCWFVVTCRFAGYTDKAQLCEQFLEIHLRPLSFAQVKTFVRKWYRIVETGLPNATQDAEEIAKGKSQDLIDSLDKPEFRERRVLELTRNPLLLTNICLVHRARGNLPHSLDQLYKECTDVLLERWRTAIGYKTKVDACSGRQVLQPVALWMHQKVDRKRVRVDELSPQVGPTTRPRIFCKSYATKAACSPAV